MAVSALCLAGVAAVVCGGETPLGRMGKMPMPLFPSHTLIIVIAAIGFGPGRDF